MNFKKKLLSILYYFFFNRTLFLEWTVKYSPIPSYFNWLYSIWNKSRRKAFHDPLRHPKKKKRKLFLELQPKWIRKWVTSIILLSSIFCLSLFHLVKFHARSLFKKVRPNPTNKTRINYESWFFKECFPSFIPDYPLFYFLFITYYAN